jgi:hypothetical protein
VIQRLAEKGPTVTRSTTSRTFVAATFWGEQYRRYFLDYCLASLMAPGNIPAIENKRDARLLLATRDEDWRAMQSEPIFIAAKQLIPVEHIRHEVFENTTRENKMSLMSQGHRLLAQKMFEYRARGVIVYPDMILADGALKKIEQLAQRGYKAVLCLAVRFANEGLIEDLKVRKLVTPGESIIVEPEELARLTIKNMHSELVRLEFDGSIDDQGAAAASFWVVKPGQNLLFHSANWAPLLIDYGSLNDHDETAFDTWTLDGDYVAKNISDVRNVYVVRDTTELFVSGFTPESQVSYPQHRVFSYSLPFVGPAIKMARTRDFLLRTGLLNSDHLKNECYSIPIRLRGGPSPEKAWRKVEQRAAKIIKQIHKGNSTSLRIGSWLLSTFRIPRFVAINMRGLIPRCKTIGVRRTMRELGRRLRGLVLQKPSHLG